MSDFLDRLQGITEPKLPVHQFQSAIRQYKRGNMTPAEIIAAFSLTAQEQTELTGLKNQVDANGLDYAQDVSDALELLEYGIWTKAKAQAVLGL